MSLKRKLKTLTLREKFDVINAVKSGMKKKDVAAQYELPASTLSTIIKKKAEILSRYESSSNLSCKRQQQAKFPDVEECLIAWFKQCRDKNISVSGPMLREKAEEFSKSLGHSSFQASNGWLINFKKRHELVFKNICGESARVYNKMCDEWKNELQSLLKDYEPKDVFNAGETGLFFNCLPDKTLILKNEKCHGGVQRKARLTILLATNMTGTEKLKPLVIGKAKNPRCFSDCKSLPMDYDANKKAWMTAEIFKEWLIKVDKKMIAEKRKILLFIDYCTAHNLIPLLKAVKVKFLPPNTTSTLQPLSQGIIKNFKTCYRKEVVRKMTSDMEQQSASPINVLHAIRMADKAWRSVSESTISNCFKSCGFLMVQEASEVAIEPDMDSEADWNILQNVEAQYDDYVTCDEGTLTDTVNQNDDDDNVSQNDVDHTDSVGVEPFISNKEARAAINKLRTYIERCNDVEDHVFGSLFALEKIIDKASENSIDQKMPGIF